MDVFSQSYYEGISYKGISCGTYTCCYCEEKTYDIKEMTTVPRGSSEIIQKWVDILGGTFLKNISSKRSRSNCFVCKSHFKETWSKKRPVNLLPFADLGRPDILAENTKNNEEMDRNKLEKRCSVYKCAYCGCIDNPCTMTAVPTTEHYFIKWVAILGEQFRKNVENRGRNTSIICKSHFDVKFQDRPESLLPKSMEMCEEQKKSVIFEENEKPNILQCCYCSEIRNNLTEMTIIPTSRLILLRWVEIFGPIFEENFLKRKNRYVCWKHFKSRKIRIFNDEIMEEFRQRQILKEKEKSFIPNVLKEEEIEMKPEIEKILIEKDFKMEDEVKPTEFKEIKQEIQE